MLKRGSFLLAHDLGLGKTVTSIASVEELIDLGQAECVLVICPASLKWQWHRQIGAFTDGALATVIEGPPGARRAQYRKVLRGDVEYVICNYEQIVKDWDIIRHIDWDVVVCDEVVAIKNPAAKRSRHVKRLQAPYKFGLSGQPIENKPEELFSIMQWIDPTVLGDFMTFERTFIVRNGFGAVQHYKNLPLLRETMGECMDRVTRHDVADQMPAVVEKSYIIEFDAATQRIYNRIARELIQVIKSVPKFSSFNLMNHYHGAEDKGAMGDIMPRLMALRMLCDHPELLRISAKNFDDPDTKLGSTYAAALRSQGVLDKLPWKSSQKMSVTMEVIEEILDADKANKIILFSFFKPMLRLLKDRYGKNSELFTGDQTPRERDEAVQHFTNDKNCRILFSSDAGGIGLDLPMANYLISYDLPFSAGKFTQRQGRILRLSSKWPEVTLLSMIMQGSVEERQWDMLEEKTAIANAWLDGEGIEAQGTFTLTLGSLMDFLEESLIP